MDFLIYLVFRAFIFLFRFIPFRLLFGFADLVYYLVYYIAGYRKKVVFMNLRNSFPGKTEQEIAAIAKGFYHHFAEMVVESLKAFTMAEEEVVSRYKFHNGRFGDRSAGYRGEYRPRQQAEIQCQA